jgi:hypothetical protein
MNRRAAVLAAIAASVCFAQTPAPDPVLSAITERITANALRADVSFLASDALEGRATPSPGLDVAAEFIASQFRRAGLQPAGNDGYFQTAEYAVTSPTGAGATVTLSAGGETIRPTVKSMAITQAVEVDVQDVDAVVISQANSARIAADQVRGKALILETPAVPAALRDAGAALAIIVSNTAPRGLNRSRFREISPSEPAFPVITIWDGAFRRAVHKAGESALKVSVKIPASSAQQATLKNVVGVLPGSDPSLKDTYVLVTAHYDHLGISPDGQGDRIFNGANDNASGSATLMEMANALAALPVRPRRSVVFIALFGEEVGEIGSGYYARHPIFPLDKTVADINLEQMGRTDAPDGPKLGQFNITGFDFTTMAPVFRKAAEDAGVRAVKDEEHSDSYFGRSDNAAFALAGVPSTTASVTYDFPDYHAVGDEWPKIDYDNMAKVDSAVALAIYRIADNGAAPEWNTANPKAEPFTKMRRGQK